MVGPSHLHLFTVYGIPSYSVGKMRLGEKEEMEPYCQYKKAEFSFFIGLMLSKLGGAQD